MRDYDELASIDSLSPQALLIVQVGSAIARKTFKGANTESEQVVCLDLFRSEHKLHQLSIQIIKLLGIHQRVALGTQSRMRDELLRPAGVSYQRRAREAVLLPPWCQSRVNAQASLASSMILLTRRLQASLIDSV